MLLYRLDNIFRTQPKLLRRLPGGAGAAEPVIVAHTFHLAGQAVLRNHAHHLAQTADDGVPPFLA